MTWEGGTGGSGDGAGTGGAIATGGSGGTVGTSGSSGDGGSGGAGTGGDPGAGGDSGGRLCLSSTGVGFCFDILYCDYAADTCGATGGTGACKPMPQGCDDIYAPACGCDGKVYSSECDANAAGFDVNANGGCTPTPDGYIPCGSRFCMVGSSYCEFMASDVGNVPRTYQCRALPAACAGRAGPAPPTCDCFPPDTPCRSYCKMIPAGGGGQGFLLTCPGG